MPQATKNLRWKHQTESVSFQTSTWVPELSSVLMSTNLSTPRQQLCAGLCTQSEYILLVLLHFQEVCLYVSKSPVQSGVVPHLPPDFSVNKCFLRAHQPLNPTEQGWIHSATHSSHSSSHVANTDHMSFSCLKWSYLQAHLYCWSDDNRNSALVPSHSACITLRNRTLNVLFQYTTSNNSAWI